MESLVISKNIVIGSTTYDESQTVTAALRGGGAWTLPDDQDDGTPLPQPGRLYVRTSNTVGTVHMDNINHFITSGMLVDVYWDDSLGDPHVQYGATVSSVSGRYVAFSGGVSSELGSVLPAVASDVIVSPRTVFPLIIVAADLEALVANCVPKSGSETDAAASVIIFQTNSSIEVFTLTLQPKQTYEWYDAVIPNPITNGSVPSPFSGDIVTVSVSHNSTTQAQVIHVDFLSD